MSSALIQLATFDQTDLESFYGKVADCLEKARKTEGRVASDEDLKLSDLLRYYMRDTSAAKVWGTGVYGECVMYMCVLIGVLFCFAWTGTTVPTAPVFSELRERQ